MRTSEEFKGLLCTCSKLVMMRDVCLLCVTHYILCIHFMIFMIFIHCHLYYNVQKIEFQLEGERRIAILAAQYKLTGVVVKHQEMAQLTDEHSSSLSNSDPRVIPITSSSCREEEEAQKTSISHNGHSFHSSLQVSDDSTQQQSRKRDATRKCRVSKLGSAFNHSTIFAKAFGFLPNSK
jgi:hypothetical protein